MTSRSMGFLIAPKEAQPKVRQSHRRAAEKKKEQKKTKKNQLTREI